jgi:hypothetical protein
MDQFLPGIELDTDEQLAIFDDIITPPPQRFQVNPVPPAAAPHAAPAPNGTIAAPPEEGAAHFMQTLWTGESIKNSFIFIKSSHFFQSASLCSSASFALGFFCWCSFSSEESSLHGPEHKKANKQMKDQF